MKRYKEVVEGGGLFFFFLLFLENTKEERTKNLLPHVNEGEEGTDGVQWTCLFLSLSGVRSPKGITHKNNTHL